MAASSVVFTIKNFRPAALVLPYAIARGINRSAGSAQTVAVRELSRDLGARAKDVRDNLRLKPARAQDLSATLTATGRRIPLISFHARGPEPSRGRGRGVTYRIRGGPQRLPHAFIATMRSGHRGVFRRAEVRRLPIIELFGPSIPLVFARRAIRNAILGRYAEVLPGNLKHEIEFELRRLEGK